MNYKEHKSEPFWWGMFSQGGVIAALLIPIHIFLGGIAIHLGLIDADLMSHERLTGLLQNPLVKLYLCVLLIFPLYHAAHRIRYTLAEIGLHSLAKVLPFLCYGGALVGTAVVLYILWVLI